MTIDAKQFESAAAPEIWIGLTEFRVSYIETKYY